MDLIYSSSCATDFTNRISGNHSSWSPDPIRLITFMIIRNYGLRILAILYATFSPLHTRLGSTTILSAETKPMMHVLPCWSRLFKCKAHCPTFGICRLVRLFINLFFFFYKYILFIIHLIILVPNILVANVYV